MLSGARLWRVRWSILLGDNLSAKINALFSQQPFKLGE
jgi:hypothetical protein